VSEVLVLDNCIGFQWDERNSQKNWVTHKVSQNECEQVFFNVPLLGRNDAEHSVEEKKYENNDL
jgi:uncharacterized DUF497 family protein